MKFVAVFVCFIGTPLVACGYLPTAGPTTGEVLDQGVQDDQIRYDVVDVDANVVSALLAQPEESFRRRFGRTASPCRPRSELVTLSWFLFGKPPAAGFSEHRPPTMSPPAREM
jgi:hypothetical protein